MKYIVKEDKAYWRTPIKKYYKGIKQFEGLMLATIDKKGQLDFKGVVTKIGWKYATIQVYGSFKQKI